jgi:hypothetical protein
MSRATSADTPAGLATFAPYGAPESHLCAGTRIVAPPPDFANGIVVVSR